jgi:hypothetical protein
MSHCLALVLGVVLGLASSVLFALVVGLEVAS